MNPKPIVFSIGLLVVIVSVIIFILTVAVEQPDPIAVKWGAGFSYVFGMLGMITVAVSKTTDITKIKL